MIYANDDIQAVYACEEARLNDCEYIDNYIDDEWDETAEDEAVYDFFNEV